MDSVHNDTDPRFETLQNHLEKVRDSSFSPFSLAAQAHAPTVENSLVPTHCRNTKQLSELCKTLGFWSSILDSNTVVFEILPYLERQHDFPMFSLVCRNWRFMARFAQALTPSRASDIRIAIEFGIRGDSGNSDESHHKNNKFDNKEALGVEASPLRHCHDGEYKLFYQGVGPPITLYCHNVMSDRPTEFISLRQHPLENDSNGRGTNYSYAPEGGSCRGRGVLTRFRKLRIDPWTLMVKTNDYTFAESSGGPLTQNYWNGERSITLNAVPYATARDSIGEIWNPIVFNQTLFVDNPDDPNPQLDARATNRRMENGKAMIDLRKTGFGIENVVVTDNCYPNPNHHHRGDNTESTFCCMGCLAYGRVSVKDDGGSYHQQIHLTGGGYAGRLVPRNDRTRDEKASQFNYDDEGYNGGWVLPLKILTPQCDSAAAEQKKEGTKWIVTPAQHL